MDKPFYIGEYDFFFLIFNISKLFCSWESGRKDYIDNGWIRLSIIGRVMSLSSVSFFLEINLTNVYSNSLWYLIWLI